MLVLGITVFSISHQFAENTSQVSLQGFRKLYWIRLAGSRPPNSDHDFFGASLAFGSALELPLGPTTELGHCMLLYKIHFLTHVTIQLRNCFCKE